ncbi:putative metal-dependent hydrolase [Sphingobacterium shayense]|uniref:YfiT family bacillithiol transferase n=1 Tax=Sphingobacterium shayense TaxID=626343 RepID=UPI0015520FE8|nr:putative metal-dependent hydrolase [Sphingobacterium shayense]NQD69928.1 putative metal-dependent hydrolase [Sphingobacterium shayense]
MDKEIEKSKYPVGKFKKPRKIDRTQIRVWIKVIEEFPNKVHNEINDLTDKELNKRYRPGGWTISQIVNHCADSHMNSLIRFKLALTEETPVIKPYVENLWAELPDSKNYPIDSSLKILAGLHERWVKLIENLTEMELDKEFLHPENNEKVSLRVNIGIYAWHCEHHLAHIINAKRK